MDVMWTGSDPVANFFLFTSYGKHTVVAEGSYAHCSKVYEVNIQMQSISYNFDEAITKINSAVLKKYSIDLASSSIATEYKHVMHIFPPVPDNFASAGGNESAYFAATPDVFPHELGHNLGFKHSNSFINESGAPIAYDDISDPMGYSGVGLRGYDSIHRDQMQWVASNLITDPFAQGANGKTLTLLPLDFKPTDFNPASGYQILRFRQAGQVNTANYYYVSVRTNKDAAGKTSKYPTRDSYVGINIHLYSKTNESDTTGESNFIARLQSPGASQTLKDGTTIKLTQVNAASQAYTVVVSRP